MGNGVAIGMDQASLSMGKVLSDDGLCEVIDVCDH